MKTPQKKKRGAPLGKRRKTLPGPSHLPCPTVGCDYRVKANKNPGLAQHWLARHVQTAHPIEGPRLDPAPRMAEAIRNSLSPAVQAAVATATREGGYLALPIYACVPTPLRERVLIDRETRQAQIIQALLARLGVTHIELTPAELAPPTWDLHFLGDGTALLYPAVPDDLSTTPPAR